MCNKPNNELLDKDSKVYINIQTGEALDLERVSTLPNNAMLKTNNELWCEWDFEKNNELGFDIWKVARGSGYKVWWICPICGENNDQYIKNRTKGVRCPVCAGKKASKKYNLMVTHPSIAKEWHSTKNGKLTPYDVLPSSEQKVWWICEKGHEYDSLVGHRTTGKNCPYCASRRIMIGYNNLNFTHPHITPLLLNKDDGDNFSFGSEVEIDFLCECGNIIRKPITSVVNYGLSCPKCKDGVSFGEKMMYHLLKDNNIKFKYDSSTSWSNNKRYDFILLDFSNAIIEIQGEHHSQKRDYYYSKSNKKTLQEEIENDNYKKDLAFSNGINMYFTIDIIDRDIDMFIESAMKSGLLEYLNITNINWNTLAEESQKSLVIDICNFYENNNYSTGEIAEIYNLARSTISRYLKLGSKIGICTYEPNNRKNQILSSKAISKPVVQLDLHGNYITTYPSAREAGRVLFNDLEKGGGIAACCRGDNKTSMGYKWIRLSDYEKLHNIN